MRGKPLAIACGAATLFLLAHLPYLPKSLDDLDSMNFALGVRSFDVAHHQPHPPGYPVFIALAKALHAVGASEVHALALLSVLAGSVGLVALIVFVASIDGVDRAFGAAALTAAAPLYWLTSARPLTDATGLAAAVVVQALTLSATGDRGLIAASFLAAFASGIRSQVAWLTVPLLVFAVAKRARASVVWPALAAFVVGGCAWGVPLVMLTGGPSGYFRALANQGSEDLTNIVMLWTTHTVSEVRLALYYAFVAPWGNPFLAGVVLALAAVGAVLVVRRRPQAAWAMALAFGPYFVFDVVFQETFTTRYALPLVLPVAYLAAAGTAVAADSAGPAIGTIALAVIAAFGMHLGGTSVAAYASEPAPAFRMLEGMASDSSSAGGLPVLALHRREDLDLRRAFVWAGPPRVAARLPAPPKHEWLELVKYWNAGGRQPVWFVADPLRSDLALVDIRDQPARFAWPLDYPVLVGGTRPGEMDWYTIPPPQWYLGEGWALTPETAGIAGEDRRGPGYAPIDGWIRRTAGTATLMIGGRNLAERGRAHVRVAIDGGLIEEADVDPGFFLRVVALRAGALVGEGDYAHVTVSADSPQLAVEQFDAQPEGRVVVGYGEGWHEREYNPATGKLWRWTSDSGVLRVESARRALVLTLEGEVEAASASRVTIRVGDRILAAHDIGRTFTIRQAIPEELVNAGETRITISTDQTYVPAERRRTADRRLLGLKVYQCRVTPAS